MEDLHFRIGLVEDAGEYAVGGEVPDRRAFAVGEHVLVAPCRAREVRWGFASEDVCNMLRLIELHVAVDDRAELGAHILGAERQEAPAGAGEIPALHAQALARGGIIRHTTSGSCAGRAWSMRV